MFAPAKSSDIGLRKAKALCGMTSAVRREFIAEGLPILFDSATSLIRASEALQDWPREADILESQAQEECAKALILIDLMRCPANRTAARTGPMMQWFYDHLARLIYADAQYWRPVTAADLQSYINNERKSHYLEGEYGEYIMPNWTLFRRESALYADVAADEVGKLQWMSPQRNPSVLPGLRPMAYKIVDALSAFGVFTPSGLEIMNQVWGACPLTHHTRWEVTCERLANPWQRRSQAVGGVSISQVRNRNVRASRLDRINRALAHA